MEPEKVKQLDGWFRFKLGATVALRAEVDTFVKILTERQEDHRRDLPSTAGLTRLLITERLLLECPGGVQLNYRGHLTSGRISYGNVELATSKEIFDFLEQELVPYPYPSEKHDEASDRA